MLSVLAALAACGDEASGGGTTEADADTDTDADADADADTDTEPTGTGLLQRVGTAVVGVDYAGTEDLQILGEDGYGEPVCVVRYDVTSVAVRSDCPACLFAFDVVLDNSAVVTDVDGACAGLGTDPAALDGTTTTRGFNADYAGHASVLMVDLGTGWQSASYGEYDEATGVFAYQWDDGFVAY
jgi:hypothetical protein